MRRPVCWWLLPAVCAPLGCDFLQRQFSERQGATASSAASAAPSVSASAAERALPDYPRRAIRPGFAADETWVPRFFIQRQAGDERLTYADAMEFCGKKRMALCSDAQWQRACAQDKQLGQYETWTLSVEGNRAVVRGGDGSCSRRQRALPGERSATRAAVCCDRAIGIRTSNRHESFLTGSAQRLIDYEQAVLNRRAGKLRQLLAEAVVFHGRERSRDEVVAALQSRSAASSLTFDRCQVEIDKEGGEPRLVSDCRTVRSQANQLSGSVLRVVHGGSETQILLVGSVADMPLLRREQKERVREFLGSE
jgi:hypothetical protein